MINSSFLLRQGTLRGVLTYGAFSSFDWPVEYFFGAIPVGQRTLRDGSICRGIQSYPNPIRIQCMSNFERFLPASL